MFWSSLSTDRLRGDSERSLCGRFQRMDLFASAVQQGVCVAAYYGYLRRNPNTARHRFQWLQFLAAKLTVQRQLQTLVKLSITGDISTLGQP